MDVSLDDSDVHSGGPDPGAQSSGPVEQESGSSKGQLAGRGQTSVSGMRRGACCACAGPACPPPGSAPLFLPRETDHPAASLACSARSRGIRRGRRCCSGGDGVAEPGPNTGELPSEAGRAKAVHSRRCKQDEADQLQNRWLVPMQTHQLTAVLHQEEAGLVCPGWWFDVRTLSCPLSRMQARERPRPAASLDLAGLIDKMVSRFSRLLRRFVLTERENLILNLIAFMTHSHAGSLRWHAACVGASNGIFFEGRAPAFR